MSKYFTFLCKGTCSDLKCIMQIKSWLKTDKEKNAGLPKKKAAFWLWQALLR